MSNPQSFAGVRLPRSPVYGTRHMVVSGHSLASLAGLRTFQRGGSVVDAMIATSAVLCVVIPQATALGGDAFILYRDARTGKTLGLNGSGPAPASATRESYGGTIGDRGPRAFTIPGIVRAWEALHRRHGRLPWRDLFADAIELAECHPLSRILASTMLLYREAVAADPGCAALYMPGGTPLRVGDLVRQPELADTLRAIAEGGSETFYEGPIARTLADYATSRGGAISPDDFAGYQPEWQDPISTEYRGHTVQVMPPNSFGLLMLMQLNGLAGIDSGDLDGDEADRLAYLMRAMRAAFAEGIPHIADPRTNPAPLDALLGAATTARLQDAVRTGNHPAIAHPPGGTSCIVIADSEGNAISVVQSVFHIFGAVFRDPSTGIMMNNRLTGFSLDPGSANVLAPGKRPAHTLNPVIVLKDGKTRFLMTTPGAPSQTVTNIQILSNMVDRGMELAAAVEAPRWGVELSGGIILDNFPAEMVDRLKERGLAARMLPGSSLYGSAKTIEVLPNGVLTGVADARREAYAVGA